MFRSNCMTCDSRIPRFIKEQEAKGLLSTIRKISLLETLLI